MVAPVFLFEVPPNGLKDQLCILDLQIERFLPRLPVRRRGNILPGRRTGFSESASNAVTVAFLIAVSDSIFPISVLRHK